MLEYFPENRLVLVSNIRYTATADSGTNNAPLHDMMKKLLMMLGALTLLAGLAYTPALAQDADADADVQEEKAETLADKLQEVEYVTKVKPKKKVYVYYFLRSRSTCGFCVHLTSTNNATYKEMKGKGAELIMLNCDPDTATAEAWADKADMKFPVVTPETAGKISVPSGGGGLPNVVAVTADGTLLESASGLSGCKELYGNWKKLVREAKKADIKKRREEEKAKAAKKKAKKKKSKAADEEAPADEDAELEL